jgi:hypothetical protein
MVDKAYRDNLAESKAGLQCRLLEFCYNFYAIAWEIQKEPDEISSLDSAMVVLILASKQAEAVVNLIFSLANLVIDSVLTKCLFIEITKCH